MLYELARRGNFFTTWIVLSVAAYVSSLAMSAIIFHYYYRNANFERWQRKLNPAYPTAAMVRREVLQMTKSLPVAALPPAIALHLADYGWSKAYTGLGGRGVPYMILTFFVILLGSDFFEFLYHRIGHISRLGWNEHKSHHEFYNPSPFAVIADGWVDQLVRASPTLIIPLLMPVNMDLMFLTFAVLFYGYGTYLHWGHETLGLSAHHPWINTSFQHYLHHARSTLHKPMHTGFFIKLWDKLFGSTYPDEGVVSKCLCSACCRARGERTLEAFAKVHRPDYKALLSPAFWWRGEQRGAAASPSGLKPTG